VTPRFATVGAVFRVADQRKVASYLKNMKLILKITLQWLLLSLKEVVRYEMSTMTYKDRQILLKCCSAKMIR